MKLIFCLLSATILIIIEAQEELPSNGTHGFDQEIINNVLAQDRANDGNQLTIRNSCKENIRVGLFSGGHGGKSGFFQSPGEQRTLSLARGWQGRVWAWRHCRSNPGDRCNFGGCFNFDQLDKCWVDTTNDVTLAEFKFDGDNGNVFYDLSLVDGFNLPMSIKPTPGTTNGGRCQRVHCLDNRIMSGCPNNLKVNGDNKLMVCRSSCGLSVAQNKKSDEYCCEGQYNRNNCKGQAWCKCNGGPDASRKKQVCGTTYTFPDDDERQSGQFDCKPSSPGRASMQITFCG